MVDRTTSRSVVGRTHLHKTGWRFVLDNPRECMSRQRTITFPFPAHFLHTFRYIPAQKRVNINWHIKITVRITRSMIKSLDFCGIQCRKQQKELKDVSRLHWEQKTLSTPGPPRDAHRLIRPPLQWVAWESFPGGKKARTWLWPPTPI